MSAFSPEYLAEIDRGSVILSDCHESLRYAENLLERDLTPNTAVYVLMALGEAAIALRACSNAGGIMPHDLDEVRDRFLAVTIRANHVAARLP